MNKVWRLDRDITRNGITYRKGDYYVAEHNPTPPLNLDPLQHLIDQIIKPKLTIIK